ncbi:hypothetical protein DAPPUDRAFT_238080 [Daphnia pulex]|uniref:Uncharacterized protein n=1 Tax=Daphnia pulex TaxID=6669 RepID=E9G552_DAPPU|nr:hypothetical protein DAPPUDRAFT_238080 [Daphnia pulex]|eukprot:EFX85441.1 hypothetical protein DAPPUDRAFT_238080 [Daphnia pulex]
MIRILVTIGFFLIWMMETIVSDAKPIFGLLGGLLGLDHHHHHHHYDHVHYGPHGYPGGFGVYPPYGSYPPYGYGGYHFGK